MGYYASMAEGALVISNEKLEEVTEMASIIYPDYSDLMSLIEDMGYEAEGGEGDEDLVITYFSGKWGDQDKFINMLALYCEDTFLHYVGEDGAHWGHEIKDGVFTQKIGKVVWV